MDDTGVTSKGPIRGRSAISLPPLPGIGPSPAIPPVVNPSSVAARPVVPTPTKLVGAEFFKIVRERNTGPDGEEIDPTLMRRLENPICRRCQDLYRSKYPGRPFQIECQGVFDDRDYQELSAATREPDEYGQVDPLTEEEVRELYDRPFWAERHVKIVGPSGDKISFVARDYQRESLLCTARYQVDRWGRGLGKSLCGVIKELHIAVTRKNFPILIACPGKAQAQMWFDLLIEIIEEDEDLRSSLAGKLQQPYFQIKLKNGSKISIFTTGSQSGRSADSLRGQSPKRVRADEQDLFVPADYKAILPLLRRFPKESEFHGSSTPTGKRETYWQMCKEFEQYRELHFPITVHPEWTGEMEEITRKEARTEINYLHEYLAEFGEQEGGVYKAEYVDAAKKAYKYSEIFYRPDRHYFLGVDWNGKGTGSRMRVIEYDPESHKRRMVDFAAVSVSTMATIDTLVQLNRKWHCDAVYVDAGFGYVQDELIRLVGAESNHPDDKKLLDVHVIDFGANLVTNQLVSKRGNAIYQQKEELERPTKPFMVEGSVILVEAGDFEFSFEDSLFEEQMRAYTVASYSRHGWANTYTSSVGDHDLDAALLALLGVEQKFGLTKIQERRFSGIGMKHLVGFGVPPPHPQDPDATLPTTKDVLRMRGNVPVRMATSSTPRAGAGIAFASRGAFGVSGALFVRPNVSDSQAGAGSRTGMFRGRSFSPSRALGGRRSGRGL